MKQTIALFLLAIFTITSTGFHVQVHTCKTSGTKSVHLFEALTSCNHNAGAHSCCKHQQAVDEVTKNCCDDEAMYIQLDIVKKVEEQLVLLKVMFEPSMVLAQVDVDGFLRPATLSQYLTYQNIPPPSGVLGKLADIQVYRL